MTKELPINTIICGDCREVMKGWPARSVDLVLTDPVWPNCPEGLLLGSDDPKTLLEEAIKLIPSTRLVIVMRHDSDPRFLTAVDKRIEFFRIQILPYVMPGYIGRKLGGDEIAYCFGKPIPSKPGCRVIPGYAPKVQPDGRKANGHPCSRALDHFIWLMKWWSVVGDLVVDPFCGSGTTCLAAKKLGRRYIGIDISSEYCEIARERLEAVDTGVPVKEARKGQGALFP